MNVSFFARGIPRAQPRPRAFARRIGGRFTARVFEAGTAEAWKADVVRAGEPYRPELVLETPVEVWIDFYLPRPKRLMRKRDPSGPVWAEGRPDVENLAKAVLDALTQDGWWSDDCLVVRLTATKQYHAVGGRPGAMIALWAASGPALPCAETSALGRSDGA